MKGWQTDRQDRQCCTAKVHSASQFDQSGPVHAFPVRPWDHWDVALDGGQPSFFSGIRAFAHRTGPRSLFYFTQYGIVMDKKVKFTISD